MTTPTRRAERWSIVCRTGDLHHVDGQSWPSAEAAEAAKQVLEHLIPKAGAWHCEPHVVVLR
jgi:hypothetical protein